MKETSLNSFKQSVSGSNSNVIRTMVMNVDKGKDVTYLILKEERRVTTSVAPIHFLVLVSLPPSCSHPFRQYKHNPISYQYSHFIFRDKERERDYFTDWWNALPGGQSHCAKPAQLTSVSGRWRASCWAQRRGAGSSLYGAVVNSAAFGCSCGWMTHAYLIRNIE